MPFGLFCDGEVPDTPRGPLMPPAPADCSLFGDAGATLPAGFICCDWVAPVSVSDLLEGALCAKAGVASRATPSAVKIIDLRIISFSWVNTFEPIKRRPQGVVPVTFLG